MSSISRFRDGVSHSFKFVQIVIEMQLRLTMGFWEVHNLLKPLQKCMSHIFIHPLSNPQSSSQKLDFI